MKKALLTLLASVWVTVAIGQTTSFTFTVPAGGCISIADNFYSGNNTLEELFPGVNGELIVYKWNAAQQGYFPPYQHIPGLGWEPGGGTLRPGEGAFISNPNTFPLTFTFRGTIQNPPARSRPAAGFYLVGCPRPVACQFEELMGFPPVPGIASSSTITRPTAIPTPARPPSPPPPVGVHLCRSSASARRRSSRSSPPGHRRPSPSNRRA